MPDNRPPKDDIVRAVSTGYIRDAEDEAPPTLYGHFTRFNEWTEIDSVWEGNFMERIAPGAFSKTIADNRSDIKVLFQHGQDPQIGDKPLGPITELREDDEGPYYEVPLLDAPYVRNDILPGLQAGLYGASFRFKVMREEFNDKAKASTLNPDAIPERTIKEARLFEFGPVTFPAYASATAGVRSLTDEYIFDRLRSKPERLRELIAAAQVPAPSVDAELVAHLEGTPQGPASPRFRSLEEFQAWLTSQISRS